MKLKLLICCAVSFCLLGGTARAQEEQGDERAGTAGAEYLLVPLTAQSAALGKTLTGGLETLSAVEALQANPAAMMKTGGSTSALFSRMEYVADIGVNYLGVVQQFGANSIGLTVSFWDFGDISRQSEDSPEISDITYSADNVVLGLSFARQFTDRIAAGFTVKGLSETIAETNAQGVAFDAGMTYVVGESGLRFGVSLQNFGPQMSYDGTGLAVSTAIDPTGDPDVTAAALIETSEAELPSLLNFGAAYTRAFAGDATVTALANFRSNAYDQDQFAGGLELGYRNLVFVRGGVDLVPDQDARFWQAWNVGAGLNLELAGNALQVDYAYRPTEFFSGVNMFTVGLSL